MPEVARLALLPGVDARDASGKGLQVLQAQTNCKYTQVHVYEGANQSEAAATRMYGQQ